MGDDIVNYRLNAVEDSIGEIKNAIKSIDATLQSLTRLEEKHHATSQSLARAFNGIEDHESRVRQLEAEMPTTRMIKGALITLFTGLVGIIGTMLLERIQ